MIEITLSIIGTILFMYEVFHNTTLRAVVTNYVCRLGDEDKLYTNEDFENHARDRFPYWLYKLLTCPICLSFHVAYLSALSFSLLPKEFGYVAVALGAVTVYKEVIHLKSNDNNGVNYPEELIEDLKQEEVLEEVQTKMGFDYVIRDNKVVVTNIHPERKDVMKIFEEDYLTDDIRLEAIRKTFFREKTAMLDKNPKCKPCEINSLKSKYYDKVKRILTHGYRPYSSSTDG